MLIKMRESKGFTLVELMIVVAIIGILAAVAVPFYQRYVQKSRLTALIWPAVHSVETNVAAYYAMRNSFPLNADILLYTQDADLQYLRNLTITANGLSAAISCTSATGPLAKLDGRTFIASAQTTGGKITSWQLTGTLADELGLR